MSETYGTHRLVGVPFLEKLTKYFSLIPWFSLSCQWIDLELTRTCLTEYSVLWLIYYRSQQKYVFDSQLYKVPGEFIHFYNTSIVTIAALDVHTVPE